MRSHRRTAAPRAAAARRAGMTLVEILVAVTILASVTLALGGYMAKSSHAATASRASAVAQQIVADRLETVKGATTYALIATTYAESLRPVPGFPAFSRATYIARAGGTATSLVDYFTVTVEVQGGGLARPLRQTTVISSF